MTITKEIFRILKKANSYAEAKLIEAKLIEGKEVSAYIWPQEKIDGYNQALDEIDEFELSEEELASIIQDAGAYWESIDDPITPLYVYIAQIIIQNQSKIFVRKDK